MLRVSIWSDVLIAMWFLVKEVWAARMGEAIRDAPYLFLGARGDDDVFTWGETIEGSCFRTSVTR